MIILERGALRARAADGQKDLAASHALRARVFPTDRAGGDRFDAHCQHVLIEDSATGVLRGSFRIFAMADGRGVARSYSAQFYDLDALESYPGAMLEIGRFCLDPESQDPDLVRLAWGALTRLVDAQDIALLFGCASFPDTDAAAHAVAFAHLAARHLAPPRWRPRRKAAMTVPLTPGPVAPARAMAAMPPLLRTYLGMGGWVSDHAVIDRTMGTMHVFTGVEIAAIPPARARLLRAIAGAETAR
ncbi:GNAT family N-acetyltransferase [Maribius pontilimi]|uniref:L-ornithine N(alpha)-acyltransferase n=1 Tax=Palleronia pontilimi TaxID=1964209 RepID=A0A934IK89_9RHOB|nr:GNAT family N-acetyltransferase [Palleronia pontilimi]MBJ3763499.1 GNAT family N-acetyltransferase [Palleronia pontilimi]